MKRLTPILLGIVVILLSILAWHQGGPALLRAAMAHGGGTLWSVLPLILAAFAVAGLLQVVVSDETIAAWMGEEAGWQGFFIGSAVGAVTPGGPYVYYPIAITLLRSGASLGTVIAFVTAKKLWSVTRLPVEYAILGPQITLSRVVVSLLFPWLVGLAAQLLFGQQATHIRQEILTS